MNLQCSDGCHQSQYSGAEVILQVIHALADYFNKNVKNL
ncbi:hypothetical protein UF75_5233 [Desulfosporosinus sp. I2]|nr:hypothetical protein UF75_5233 [Desulfosporosinus sp. I2]